MSIKIDKNLFWDVNFKSLEYQKDADFIINRVLLWGDKPDYDVLKKQYSYEKIRESASKINYNEKKIFNFWNFILNLPKKCTRKLLIQKQNAFWNR